jgi:nitrate reductase gamma subunit
MTDLILFAVFPYVAVTVAIVVALYRYFGNRFSYSTLSSQFLENRTLFWGSVPWHYGILFVLAGHLVGLLLPRGVLAWNGVPWRLYVLEISALAFALLALWGLAGFIVRRLTNRRVRAVTSPMDWVLLVALFLQVSAGIWTALFYRWGTSWYAGFAVPYLYSLLAFRPDFALVQNLPVIVRLHIVGGFVILLLLPFTRLVHLLALPVTYLWRPYQVVIWNRRPAQAETSKQP